MKWLCNTTGELQEEACRKLSRALARFFMLGIVPFLFTIVVTVALLMFLGVDVAQEVAGKSDSVFPSSGRFSPRRIGRRNSQSEKSSN